MSPLSTPYILEVAYFDKLLTLNVKKLNFPGEAGAFTLDPVLPSQPHPQQVCRSLGAARAIIVGYSLVFPAFAVGEKPLRDQGKLNLSTNLLSPCFFRGP